MGQLAYRLSPGGHRRRDGEADGAQSWSLMAAGARLAMCRREEAIARKLFDQVGEETPLNLHSVIDAATVGAWLGEHERAMRIVTRRPIVDSAPVLVRLVPELHPLAYREPFAPRKCPMSLVWPLEAPMMLPSVHAMFRDVRVESGLEDGSALRLS